MWGGISLRSAVLAVGKNLLANICALSLFFVLYGCLSVCLRSERCGSSFGFPALWRPRASAPQFEVQCVVYLAGAVESDQLSTVKNPSLLLKHTAKADCR